MTAGPIDHLTLDAVVAYADGEMSMVSYQRAAAHIALCPQCDAEVRAQLTARSWLRAACVRHETEKAPALRTRDVATVIQRFAGVLRWRRTARSAMLPKPSIQSRDAPRWNPTPVHTFVTSKPAIGRRV